MKKILVLLLISSINSITANTEDVINFPDKNFKNALLNHHQKVRNSRPIDTNNNNDIKELSTENCEDLKELDCTNNEMYSLIIPKAADILDLKTDDPVNLVKPTSESKV